MYTQYEAEAAEKELAHIANTKQKALAVLLEGLGGLVDAATNTSGSILATRSFPITKPPELIAN